MRIEPLYSKVDISDLSSIVSIRNTPSRASSFNDTYSSISSARGGGAIKTKSFFTWVYEGFCLILALIWNFFSSPTNETNRDRRVSDERDSNPAGSQSGYLSEEEYFPLKESRDSNLSDSTHGSHISDLSGVLVNRPSDHGSELSQTTGSSAGGVPSADLSLGSNQTSLGSEPQTSGSNPQLTGSDVSHEENFGYTLAKAEDIINEVDIPSYVGNIPSSLRISVQNQTDIREVLKTIGGKTAWELGYNSVGALWGAYSGDIAKLNRLGANIDRDVHPFRFLLEIFLTPESNAAIKALHASRKDTWTGRNLMWSRFVTDLASSFKKRSDIADHTTFFAHRLGLNTNDIKPFVDKKNWEGLLKYLVAYVTIPNAVSAR